MSDVTKCRPGEHRYEGRYDLREPDAIDSFFGRKSEKDKIYVRDVCTRCGDAIRRER